MLKARPVTLIAVMVFWLLHSLACSVQADELINVSQPYSAELSNPVEWDGELIFTITAPYKTKLLRVWIPVPPSDVVQQVRSTEFFTYPVDIKPRIETEATFGNTFAYFEFPNPLGGVVITHRLTIQTHELRWNMNPDQIKTPAEWPASFTPFLRSEEQAVVADERFGELLQTIVPQRKNPLVDLEAVMTFADRNFVYDHDKASLKASSVHALDNRRGHCSDYHGFCAAAGRVMQLPTRVTYGINPFPKASPSHCKLEVFLPPHGWVSFDVSETQKLSQAIRKDAKLSESEKSRLIEDAHRRLVSGFRDNTWFLQTRGTDYDLAPRASQKVAVVRTLYAEADGRALPDPDPSSSEQTTFAWMTAHRFRSNVPAANPFSK
jgi:transglutaminase-like putative cysteine protease